MNRPIPSAPVRRMIDALAALPVDDAHRSTLKNAVYALHVLAEVLDGTDPRVAGMRCTRCRAPLRESPPLCIPAPDNNAPTEPWRDSLAAYGDEEPRVCEVVCGACYARADGEGT